VLATPIVARGVTTGVFLALNKPGGFISYSVEGVKEFAHLLGLALEIVLLDEALKQGKRFEDLPFEV
jgi:GAF domain-containing protein